MFNDSDQGFITIQSSELLFLKNELADIGSRAFAYILDVLIRGAVIFVMILVFSRNTIFFSSLNKIFIPLIFIWWTGYFVFFEIIYSGKTPGKKIVGIRVLRTDGSRISLLDSCVRNVLRAVDMLPFGYMLAIVTMLFEQYNRRLGDLVANTIVIYDRSSNKSIKKFVENMLVDSKPRRSILIKGLENLNPNDKLIIKNLYSRLGTIQAGIEKDNLMDKFYEKIKQKISVEGTEDPEVLLCELYKRI